MSLSFIFKLFSFIIMCKVNLCDFFIEFQVSQGSFISKFTIDPATKAVYVGTELRTTDGIIIYKSGANLKTTALIDYERHKNDLTILNKFNDNLLVCRVYTCIIYKENKDTMTNVYEFVMKAGAANSLIRYIKTNEYEIVISKNKAGSPFTIFSPAKNKGNSGFQFKQDVRITQLASFQIFKSSYFIFTLYNPNYKPSLSTRIAALCDNSAFKFYIDVGLNCSNIDIEVAHFVNIGSQFANSHGYKAMSNTNVLLLAGQDSKLQSYGVCVLSYFELYESLNITKYKCLRGEGEEEENLHVESHTNCANVFEKENSESLCDPLTVGDNTIIRKKPLIVNKIIKSVNYTITAITAKEVYNDTVVFLGTESGFLLQYWLEKRSVVQRYKIDDSPVLSNLEFDDTKEFLFIGTKNKVVKWHLTECNKYNSCSDCVKTNNPHCGWCTLDAKCTTKRNCKDNTITNGWLQASETCIKVNMVTPSYIIHVTNHAAAQIKFKVDRLPTMSTGKFMCHLVSNTSDCANWSGRNKQFSYQATRTNDEFSCNILPAYSHFSKYGRSSVCLELAPEKAISIVSYPIVIVNCSNVVRCGVCVDKETKCYWCKNSVSCIDASEQCSLTDTKIIDKQDCPVIDAEKSHKYIPSGIRSDIALYGRNFMYSQNYRCGVVSQGKFYNSNVTWINVTLVKCTGIQFSYPDEVKMFETRVELFLNEKPIEENGKAVVTYYKCEYLTKVCTLCKYHFGRQFNCNWCKPGVCRYNTSCDSHIVTCAKTVLNKVSPLMIATNTTPDITIEGTNLYTDINRVQVKLVDTKSCIVDTSVDDGKQIVCKAEVSLEELSGHVVLNEGNRSATFTESKFQYITPRVLHVSPAIGPRSGGTTVEIRGQYFNIGTSILVRFGNTACETESGSLNGSYVKCVTKTMTVGDHRAVLEIDDVSYRSTVKFTASEDPYVSFVEPSTSIKSGSRIITVTGGNLGSIQQPKIFVVPKDAGDVKLCEVISGESMTCPSPLIKQNHVRTRRSVNTCFSRDYRLGFIMDDVASVLNSSLVITYRCDPVFYNLSSVLEFQQHSKHIVLNGSNLNVALTDKEVKVMISSSVCNIKSLLPNELICEPSPEPPESKQYDEILPIVVNIGSLKFHVGHMKYVEQKVSLVIIISTVVVIFVLIVVIAIIIVVCRRKNINQSHKIRQLEFEMESREEKIREEARAEFIAFQRDMDIVTQSLVDKGVPLQSRTTFIFSILFPTEQANDSPLLKKNETTEADNMAEFKSLLDHPSFIAPVISRLDRCLTSAKERAFISALLTLFVIDSPNQLQIIRDLISNFVEKSVNKRDTKQILRRNETVTENLLSNWLFISLYDSLEDREKDSAGRSLFLMYKAVCQVTNNGPVDAVTGDTYYSLREDTLLKHNIESNNLTIEVQYINDTWTCQVLMCDTITQVKCKVIDEIFKNVPASKRPRHSSLELDWRAGQSGQLRLRDVDKTCQIDNQWMRLNTVQHFNVSANSSFVLVQVDGNSDTLQIQRSVSSNTCTSNDSLISSTDRPHQSLWHLVKRDINDVEGAPSHQIDEIYLTRLFRTKIALKKTLDDLFNSLFSSETVAKNVIHLFRYFDQLGKEHGLDKEVVQMWKSNCLPIRIWSSLIKSPQIIFDVEENVVVEPTLLILSQCLIDACSYKESGQTKTSSPTKLLFCKDLVTYREIINNFYDSVAALKLPSNTDPVITEVTKDFNLDYAKSQLLNLFKRFDKQIIEELGENSETKLAFEKFIALLHQHPYENVNF